MKNWQLTKEQYISRKYNYMRDRVTDPKRSEGGRHYYNLPICSRQEFFQFANSNPKFSRLFKTYKRSRGNRAKAPSVDRIDIYKGYTLNNIQFLTLSDNVLKVHSDKWFTLKSKKTGKLFRFASTLEVGRFLNHKGRVKTTRKSFFNVKTKEHFINTTKLSLR